MGRLPDDALMPGILIMLLRYYSMNKREASKSE